MSHQDYLREVLDYWVEDYKRSFKGWAYDLNDRPESIKFPAYLTIVAVMIPAAFTLYLLCTPLLFLDAIYELRTASTYRDAKRKGTPVPVQEFRHAVQP